jgi:hypothetical protein
MGLMQMLLWRKNFEDGNCPSTGLFAAPYLEFPELSLISYVNPIEKYHFAFEPRTGTEFKIYSQGKFTTLRCKNRKVRHEHEILKANERLHKV